MSAAITKQRRVSMTQLAASLAVALLSLSVFVPEAAAESVSTGITPGSGVSEDTSQLDSSFRSSKKVPVITLGFDDGTADHRKAAAILDTYDLEGTFFVQSGLIGVPGYLTESDLKWIQARGNEIGSHTVNHTDLTSVSKAEAVREVCMDRLNLSKMGIKAKSFAYPYAAYNADAQAAVKECGFNSARILGGIKSHKGCADCPPTESLKPADPYAIRAPAQVESDWTLKDLVALVEQAKLAGGWMPITLHRICQDPGCSPIGISETLLAEFAAYLEEEEERNRIDVETFDDVVEGARSSIRKSGWDIGQSATSGNRVMNSGLEAWAAGAASASCWELDTWGDAEVAASTSSTPIAGANSAEVNLSGYVDGATAWMQKHDLGECAPAAEPGSAYDLSVQYSSDTSVQFVVHLRNARGTWQYWDSSPWFDASESPTSATWRTQPVPAGFTGISYGMSIFSNGTLVTDEYSMVTARTV